ncbi:hypothetical protein DBV14_02335 [Variovorax sp. KBW07]|nr:hypothetical protein DBV14_02335 [Variovorax sp. KBW07]
MLGSRPPFGTPLTLPRPVLDMAKLGCFLLQDGRRADQQVLPPGFAAQMVRPQDTGGPPVGLPCGLFWWAASGPPHIASGYAGQAMRLMRGRNFQAAQRRMALNGK